MARTIHAGRWPATQGDASWDWIGLSAILADLTVRQLLLNLFDTGNSVAKRLRQGLDKVRHVVGYTDGLLQVP